MDYKKAATYWVEKDKDAVRMEPDLLLSKIEKFIKDHNTCTLATGYGDFVRCTPMEYTYKEGKLWMFTEGGLKFLGLESNKNVCIAIFDNYTGFGQLNGMQISGLAEIVEPWTKDYMDMLAFKNIPSEKLKKLPTTMYLIKVNAARIEFLSSEFKNTGCDSRQYLDLTYNSTE